MFGMDGWCKEPNNAGNGSDCPKNAQNSEDRTTGDLISRAAAIDDLHGKDPSQIWDTADIEVWVNALPSAQPKSYREGYQAGFKDAQPERKRGKWKMDLKRHVFVCSICGAWQVFNCNYCSNCGTDMREVDE